MKRLRNIFESALYALAAAVTLALAILLAVAIKGMQEVTGRRE